jgi:hypothetical protein
VRTYFGILGNYEFGSPTTMNRDAGVIQTFGTQGTGTSWDNTFGASVFLQKTQFFSEKIGLSLLAGYSSSSGEFHSDYFQDLGAIKDFRVISKTGKFGLEGFISYALSSNFFAGVGLWGNYRMKNDITQQLEVISPLTHDTIIATGSSISTSKFHYGIPVILGGRFPLTNVSSINAEVYGRVDLTEALRGHAGEALSIGIRLGVSFSIDPAALAAPPSTFVSENASLFASIHFTTNGKSIKSITARIVDTTSTSYQMLPSKVIFEPGSNLLRSQVLLDIIGKRMQDMPESELHISSAYSVYETDELALNRTERIEAYLDTAWKISRTRIKKSVVHSQKLSYCELSDNSKILSPIVNEVTEQSFSVSPISLSRFISSQAGVRSWQGTIRDENNIIAQFSSEDSVSGDNPVQTLPVKDKILYTKLHVTDNYGQIREASDTLIIKVANVEAHPITFRYIFLLLPDSSENSIKWMVPLEEKISQLVSEKSVVRFQPLFPEGSKSIQLIAGRLLSALQLNPAAKIEIITAVQETWKNYPLWKDEKEAFIITISN